MAERPILFSGPMVRAILSGAKTQTRRVVKPQPIMRDRDCVVEYGKQRHSGPAEYLLGHVPPKFGCPYGKPGDVLWLKETWRTRASLDHLSPNGIELAARSAGYSTGPCGPLQYIADGHSTQWGDCDLQDFGPWGKTRVSIHMPRWASRLTLRIKSVRVERLQDISEADAQHEGCSLECMTPTGDDSGSAIHGPGGFLALWESINGPGSWDANPFVWVIEFERQ